MDVKLIALRCAGFNNVDLKAAAEYGIPVVRVPAYSPHAVAEYAVMLMLTLNRKVHRAYWRTRDGNFSLHGLLGFDMYGKTAGIVGTGKIARELIRILKGFGMEVLAYDIYPDPEYAVRAQIEYVSLDELYRRSDIISLHCPLTDATRYMIDGAAIGRMKPGVMLINTGRGQLIHTEALIEGLKEKKIGAAGLDVYEEEAAYFYEDTSDRIMDDDVLARLLSFNNVVMTSHQGFFTREALDNIAHTTLQNINDFAVHRGCGTRCAEPENDELNDEKSCFAPPRRAHGTGKTRFTGWTDVDLSEKASPRPKRPACCCARNAYTSYLAGVKTLGVVLDKRDQDWVPVSKSWRLNGKHYALCGDSTKRNGERIRRRAGAHLAPQLRRGSGAARRRGPAQPALRSPLPRRTRSGVAPHRVAARHRRPHHALLEMRNPACARPPRSCWSLRSIIKHLKGISDEAISEFNPRPPCLMSSNSTTGFVRDYFLSDPEEIAADAAVADQGRK